jgi:hypothetical protein
VGSLKYRQLFPLDPMVQVESLLNGIAVDTHPLPGYFSIRPDPTKLA